MRRTTIRVQWEPSDRRIPALSLINQRHPCAHKSVLGGNRRGWRTVAPSPMGTKGAAAGVVACRRVLRDLLFRGEGIAGASSVAGAVRRPVAAREGRGYATEAAPVEVAPRRGLLGGREGRGPGGLELVGATKDYYDYRRSLYGDVTHKALLVDAVGTLLVPSQPTAQIYRKIGEKYGVEYSEDEILNRYRWAYEQPWGHSRLRYVDDGRPFWQFIVSSSTGCSNSQYFEELYQYYMTDKAWHLCDPDAERVFKALRKAGIKIAVVSNFDTRLRPLLQALKCDHWFDAVAVSAEASDRIPYPLFLFHFCSFLAFFQSLFFMTL
ncbi:hypothetical protein Taro_004769 [Colocasia esculenta]|uniref:Haloacid dehalogenase-like hydrolase domain-containing protein 3 n=1 Tax=Colocasia esculenta TaxID=4460 RepID=A0A843TQY7_COLES|nr:hypothetical protein [Colocasia esculenta]